MLISKPIAPGDIISIKTTAGEELIAKLVEETPNGIKVSKPLCLIAAENGIALVPFLWTTEPDKAITINMAGIMVTALTAKDAADKYIKQTTGIELV